MDFHIYECSVRYVVTFSHTSNLPLSPGFFTDIREHKKRAAREGRPGSYRMKLSNNHEIAVSSSPILWTPSRIRLRISGRGFLQPEA